MERYEKLKISLRYYLLGKSFFKAADALEFAAEYHDGFRKDGVTPEFQHQIEIAHYLRTMLPWFQYPQETLIATLLHDVTEDHGVLVNTVGDRYGAKVSEAVNILDKNGKSAEQYFFGIAHNPIASLVKGGDRIHNVNSMVGVFSKEKQIAYVYEVRYQFLPMLKIARHKFVSQEAAYENIKHTLVTQLNLLDHILDEEAPQ